MKQFYKLDRKVKGSCIERKNCYKCIAYKYNCKKFTIYLLEGNRDNEILKEGLIACDFIIPDDELSDNLTLSKKSDEYLYGWCRFYKKYLLPLSEKEKAILMLECGL